MLLLDAESDQAKAGLAKIAEVLLDSAIASIEQGEFLVAEKTISQAEAAAPTHPKLARISERLAMTRMQAMDRLYEQALADIDALRLVSPAGGNALSRAEVIAEQAPEDLRAAEIRHRIVEQYVALGQQFLANGNVVKAQEQLQKAQSLLPMDDVVDAFSAQIEAQARVQSFGNSTAAEQTIRADISGSSEQMSVAPGSLDDDRMTAQALESVRDVERIGEAETAVRSAEAALPKGDPAKAASLIEDAGSAGAGSKTSAGLTAAEDKSRERAHPLFGQARHRHDRDPCR